MFAVVKSNDAIPIERLATLALGRLPRASVEPRSAKAGS
jgi:hypothetical protein